MPYSIDTLNFEGAFEAACLSVLAAKGITCSYIQAGNTELTLPRVELKLVWGGFTDQHFQFVSGVKYPDSGTGVLYVKIVTERKTDKTDHYRLRAACRYYLYNVTDLTTKMTHHTAVFVKETGTAPDISPSEHADISVLSFNVKLQIKTASINL